MFNALAILDMLLLIFSLVANIIIVIKIKIIFITIIIIIMYAIILSYAC